MSNYVCAWKVGSGDITWPEIIEAMASRHLPILIATGASDMEDVRRAVAAASAHEKRIVLMQCNTNYTGSLENFSQIALNVLKAYAREFPDVVLGISDHTPGCAVVLGAVTLGARVVEKHFTDDRGREGPDHAFSMGPSDWRDMVDRTRELEAALGTEDKHVMKTKKIPWCCSAARSGPQGRSARANALRRPTSFRFGHVRSTRFRPIGSMMWSDEMRRTTFRKANAFGCPTSGNEPGESRDRHPGI